jgi:hypothetical protein
LYELYSNSKVDNEHARCTKMLELTDDGNLKEIPLNQAKQFSRSAKPLRLTND